MNIKTVNRKAKFEYEFEYTIEAGIVLKSQDIREWKRALPSLSDAYAYVKHREIFIKNLGDDKKLLLNRREINKINAIYSGSGILIIAMELYRNKKGLFKLLIGVGKKLKEYDKRHKLKEKDSQRRIKAAICGDY